MTDKLRRCPCGGKSRPHEVIAYMPTPRAVYSIRCDLCGVEIYSYLTLEAAIAAWNQRAYDEPVRELVDEIMRWKPIPPAKIKHGDITKLQSAIDRVRREVLEEE